MVQEIPFPTRGFWDSDNGNFILVNPIYVADLDSDSDLSILRATNPPRFFSNTQSGIQYWNVINPLLLDVGLLRGFITLDGNHDSSVLNASGYNILGSDHSYRMPFSGSVQSLSLQLNVVEGTGNTFVNIYKNDSNTSKSITIDCSGPGPSGNHATISNLPFVKGDTVTLAITHDDPTLRTSGHNGIIYFYYSESL